MMSAVVDSMVVFLSAQPDPLLVADRIGDRLPSTASDVPAVALSLAIDGTRGTGLGSFLREGNQLVQNTSIVDVAASPTTFSADLRTLRVPQAPIRRNPASGSLNFSAADAGVTRITGPDQPVTYRYAERPAAADEFRLDPLRGLIVFGAPQPAGGRLQLAYWTVDFREAVTGGHCHGTIALEVWGGSAGEAAALARKLQSKLLDRPGLRQRGFSAVLPAGLNPAENTSYQPATGSAFAVWKQKLSYRFHFDFEQGGETSSGGPILKVNVEMDGALEEQFSTPPGS